MVRKAALLGLLIALALMAVSCSEDSSGPKNTAPEVSIAQPADGATRAGVVDVMVEASDDDGIDAVEFYVGGTLYTTDTEKPYSFEYDMSSAGDTVSIYAKAIDIAGKTASTNTITITKGGTAPVISSATADVSEVMQGYLVNLSGDATDAEDGVLEDADIAWSSSLQGSLKEGKNIEYRGFVIGDHVITMTATDSNGNTVKQSFNLKVTENDQDFAYIQEGSYTIGPPAFEARTVLFDRPFLISKTEYTIGDFVDNMNNDTFTATFHDRSDTEIDEFVDRMEDLVDNNGNPLYPTDLFSDADKYRNYPVCFIGAIEIFEYIQALSKFDGLDVAYEFWDKKNIVLTEEDRPRDYAKAIIIDDSKGWRLPTEAEWEVAANAGSGGQKYPWGNHPPGSRANTLADNSPSNMVVIAVGRGITPVNSYAPNGFGIYDLGGNVAELCSDFAPAEDPPFMSILPSGVDPVGDTEADPVNNLAKGGAWSQPGAAAQVTVRQMYLPMDSRLKNKDAFNSAIGFRVVRNLDSGEAPW